METLTSQSIQFKGFTIEPSLSYFGGFEYFPTSDGRQDDADFDGEDYIYCGNVKHAATIEEAKDEIDEKIMTSLPDHQVKMNGRTYFFPWVEDAIKFAVQWDGELFPICNA